MSFRAAREAAPDLVPVDLPVDDLDPRALEPGAMQTVKERELPCGYTVRFEYAPAGWMTKKGTPRRDDWRRYFLHVTGEPVKRRDDMVNSVTTICDAILPKDGLPIWAERMGIRGALEAFRRGIAHTGMTAEELVEVVREAKLGADAAKYEAADRGLNVHALLENFMLTGQPPNPADHPEAHRPFIQGLIRWLIHRARNGGLDPVAVETVVGDPERRYAGRLDLLAQTISGLTLIDLKTQENGAIYESAHVQTRLYWDAEERYGEHRIKHAMVVVVDAHGKYREMDLAAAKDLTSDALSYYRKVKPLAADCDRMNSDIRNARRLAVAA